MGESDWQGKVAIVTGASEGIGAALTRRLNELGVRVVMVAPTTGAAGRVGSITFSRDPTPHFSCRCQR